MLCLFYQGHFIYSFNISLLVKIKNMKSSTWKQKNKTSAAK